MKEIFKNITVQLFTVFFLSATLLSMTTEVNDSHGYFSGGILLIPLVIFVDTIWYAFFMGKYDASINIKGIHWSRGIIRFILLGFFPYILAIQQ